MLIAHEEASSTMFTYLLPPWVSDGCVSMLFICGSSAGEATKHYISDPHSIVCKYMLATAILTKGFCWFNRTRTHLKLNLHFIRKSLFQRPSHCVFLAHSHNLEHFPWFTQNVLFSYHYFSILFAFCNRFNRLKFHFGFGVFKSFYVHRACIHVSDVAHLVPWNVRCDEKLLHYISRSNN